MTQAQLPYVLLYLASTFLSSVSATACSWAVRC